jgi:hypothetical protein
VSKIEEDPDKHFINAMSKKYTGQAVYQGNQPGDERVVVYVTPEHTTHMG